MKKEDELWIDYILRTHDKETLDRVELVLRAIVVTNLTVLEHMNDAYQGALSELIYIDGVKEKGFRVAPEIWESILDAINEPNFLVASAIDETMGLIHENFVTAISNEQLVAKCKEYLANPDIKATYTIKSSIALARLQEQEEPSDASSQ